MYKLPFRLAEEPDEDQRPLEALPANHFLNSAPARLSSPQGSFSLEQQHAAWNAAYLGGSLASADFDIDVATGFMPSEPPITRLTGQYSIWEDVWDASAGLETGGSLAGERWRSQLRQLPVLPTAELTTLAELRRAHLILSFLAHRYIHAGGSSKDDVQTSKTTTTPSLPEPVARPWLQVSDRLDMPPILTYADTVLYNWTLIQPELGLSPDNLRMVTTFTGTRSEEHFYMTSLLIELQGAVALRLMATSLDELFVNDALAHQRIVENLFQLSSIIDDLSEIFETIYADCDPEVFYNSIRFWFPGGQWSFDMGPTQPAHQQDFGGPSAGQSTLIHALDVFLGVDHRPNKGAQDHSFDDTFMQRMSTYMPHHHRLFLMHLSAQSPTLRSIVLAGPSDSTGVAARLHEDLAEAYDASIDALTRLRQVHTNVVYEYIILPSKKASGHQQQQDSSQQRDSRTSTTSSGDAEAREAALKGTGGTNLVSFLRSTKQRTIAARSRVASRS